LSPTIQVDISKAVKFVVLCNLRAQSFPMSFRAAEGALVASEESRSVGLANNEIGFQGFPSARSSIAGQASLRGVYPEPVEGLRSE